MNVYLVVNGDEVLLGRPTDPTMIRDVLMQELLPLIDDVDITNGYDNAIIPLAIIVRG